LYYAALLGTGKFDPTRSQWATFIERIVANRAIDIIRRHRLHKRFEVLITDLADEGYSGDSPLFGVGDIEGNISPGTRDGMMYDLPRDVTEHSDLTLDVAITMSAMSPFLRQIAQCLLDGLRVVDMTHIFQMPYTSLHYHVRRVRAIFAAHHLDLYVDGLRNSTLPRRKKSK
jgi:DNA-directed RNA polymerase specialized sigma24 family protein